ncbi:hypothetical protein LguiB_024568 [Lonicera macranthoides]
MEQSFFLGKEKVLTRIKSQAISKAINNFPFSLQGRVMLLRMTLPRLLLCFYCCIDAFKTFSWWAKRGMKI